MKATFITISLFFLSYPLLATTIIAKGRRVDGAAGQWAQCNPTYSNETCNVYQVDDNLTDTIYCLNFVPDPILINGRNVKEYNEIGQLIWQGNVQKIDRTLVGSNVKYTIVQ
jgi:hypothetical protein